MKQSSDTTDIEAEGKAVQESITNLDCDRAEREIQRSFHFDEEISDVVHQNC